MSDDRLILETKGAVRVIAMNRPEKLNALDFALTRALLAALQAAEADEAIGCVVLTGKGRGFCAGADMNEFKELTPENRPLVAERARLTTELHGIFPRLGKPVLAAVNGAAMGGGAGLALACDLVLAAEGARFAYPEVKHGIVAAIVMANLVRVVGRKAAFELVATGLPIEAHRALALGMVNRVVPEAELMQAAMALAESIAGFSRPAMALTKSLFYQVADLPFAQALEAGRAANERMRGLRTSGKAS
jgi:enoyl-CoA hydratase